MGSNIVEKTTTFTKGDLTMSYGRLVALTLSEASDLYDVKKEQLGTEDPFVGRDDAWVVYVGDEGEPRWTSSLTPDFDISAFNDVSKKMDVALFVFRRDIGTSPIIKRTL